MNLVLVLKGSTLLFKY